MAGYNLRHLAGVAALRRSRRFAVAAAEISLTQSALTQAVAALESKVDRKLFDRGPRGTRPTAAGEVLSDSIDLALQTIDAADPIPGDAAAPLSRRATMTQLLAVAAVEAAGGYRRAARNQGISEASIHRAVRSLEQGLDTDLFVTTEMGSAPTRTAVRIARAVRQAMATLQAGVEAARAGDERRVRIGAMPLARAGLLPSMIGHLRRQSPALRVHIVEASYDELLARLLDGDLDMVLGALRSDTPDGAVQHALFDDTLVVAARSDHPLARSSDWHPVALANHPWVTSLPGTPRRLRWEEMLAAAGAPAIAPQVECSSASTARGLLLQGDWLAMLSPDQFRIERELGILTVIGGALAVAIRSIGVTMRAPWAPADHQQAALAALAAAVGRPNPERL